VIVPDVNLLLYAYDSSSPFHARARAWWSGCLSGTEAVGLTHAVVFGFVRVGTNARVYQDPWTLADATSHVRAWLARRAVRLLLPDVDHVDRVLDLLAAAGSAGGNLVTDAQIAALALQHGADVHTADRDILRFKGVRCRFPLDD
jgi:toxin-antitoxin system PIN domain toxin